MKPSPTHCPCSPSRLYAQCCGPYHQEPGTAPTAEALMRSRYSAYVLDLLDYLRRSWAPETCPPDLQPNPPGLKWLGLEVRHCQDLGPHEAQVCFVARHKWQGRAQRLVECSRFERRAQGWVYVEGQGSDL